MTEDRKKISSFEDLQVFQLAYKISLEIHKASLEFPGENNMDWPIKSVGHRNRYVPTLLKVLGNKISQSRSLSDI